MSFVCDLFIATPEIARKYERMLTLGETMQSIIRKRWESLSQLHFEILWAIIEGRRYIPDTLCLIDLYLAERTSLFEFPGAYTDQLSELKSDRIDFIAHSWAATEELDCSPEEAEEILTSSIRLARLAKEKKQRLYLWGSV
jgi:hypothetical protein